ncbi:hypothetical protein Q5P01_018063 [Channa striata]|uniref:Uncharacterized protein n=1 Tax=Channa striata TaxID=64152 RepID=A0AA88M4T0_CHASR|nr:hypothetical protein Q5P01_018063 [Channa striata]
MKFLGVVKGTSLLWDQLVLMTCEDKKVYGFNGRELHLVAEELQLAAPATGLMQPHEELCKIKYPGLKTYYRGEAFKEMTDKDWAKVKKSDVGRRLDEEHHKLVEKNKSKLLENLRIIREKLGGYLYI